MISVNELKFTYPDNSFSINISELNIKSGDSIAIYGPSGTGKSTFLNLLSGALTADSGSIKYNEQAYEKLSNSALKKLRLNEFGIVFQQAELIEWMSAKDNILLPRKFSEKPQVKNDRFNELVERAELSKLLDKSAGRLSIGEQMRVAIVRAIIAKPKLILADEPTASLDPKLRKQMINLLIEESKKLGATLILVSHDDYIISKLNNKISSEYWAFQ